MEAHPPTKKARVQSSAGKMMLTVVCEQNHALIMASWLKLPQKSDLLMLQSR